MRETLAQSSACVPSAQVEQYSVIAQEIVLVHRYPNQRGTMMTKNDRPERSVEKTVRDIRRATRRNYQAKKRFV